MTAKKIKIKPDTQQKPNKVITQSDIQNNDVKFIVRQELRDSEEWKRLKLEFTGEELKLFEEKYVSLMSQFKGDVLQSEATQIMQSIKLEIMMSRILVSRQEAVVETDRLKKMSDDIMRQVKGDVSALTDRQKETLLMIRTQLNQTKAVEDDRTAVYTKLHSEHKALMKDLKATRDQRVKEIESGKISVLGLLKMLQRKDVQEQEGRESELVKIAMAKEYKRLGSVHKYDDGAWDRPILSSETVDIEQEASVAVEQENMVDGGSEDDKQESFDDG